MLDPEAQVIAPEALTAEERAAAIPEVLPAMIPAADVVDARAGAQRMCPTLDDAPEEPTADKVSEPLPEVPVEVSGTEMAPPPAETALALPLVPHEDGLVQKRYTPYERFKPIYRQLARVRA